MTEYFVDYIGIMFRTNSIYGLQYEHLCHVYIVFGFYCFIYLYHTLVTIL